MQEFIAKKYNNAKRAVLIEKTSVIYSDEAEFEFYAGEWHRYILTVSDKIVVDISDFPEDNIEDSRWVKAWKIIDKYFPPSFAIVHEPKELPAFINDDDIPF